jgi:predicted nucleic acid-binding protein
VTVLVDTSVWIDHLRILDAGLSDLLQHGAVVAHPWVAGEIALGNLRNRGEVLGSLHGLPQATVAEETEVLGLIEHEALFGMGLGYVDVQLLAATKLTEATLWSRDGCLSSAASRLGLGYRPVAR